MGRTYWELEINVTCQHHLGVGNKCNMSTPPRRYVGASGQCSGLWAKLLLVKLLSKQSFAQKQSVTPDTLMSLLGHTGMLSLFPSSSLPTRVISRRGGGGIIGRKEHLNLSDPLPYWGIWQPNIPTLAYWPWIWKGRFLVTCPLPTSVHRTALIYVNTTWSKTFNPAILFSEWRNHNWGEVINCRVQKEYNSRRGEATPSF